MAILKRLDDLEGLLIRNRSPEPPLPNPDSSTPLSAPHSDLGSSYMVDVWARAKRPLVSVEAVLQWPSFSEYGFPSRLYPTPSVEDEKLSADSSSWRVAVDIDLPAAEAVVRKASGGKEVAKVMLPTLGLGEEIRFEKKTDLDGWLV